MFEYLIEIAALLFLALAVLAAPSLTKRSRYDWGRTKNEHKRSDFFTAYDPWEG